MGKWLSAEALPNASRYEGMAEEFKVNTAWLRDGTLPRERKQDPHFAEFERKWHELEDEAARTDVLEFIDFKLGAGRKSAQARDTRQEAAVDRATLRRPRGA